MRNAGCEGNGCCCLRQTDNPLAECLLYLVFTVLDSDVVVVFPFFFSIAEDCTLLCVRYKEPRCVCLSRHIFEHLAAHLLLLLLLCLFFFCCCFIVFHVFIYVCDVFLIYLSLFLSIYFLQFLVFRFVVVVVSFTQVLTCTFVFPAPMFFCEHN